MSRVRRRGDRAPIERMHCIATLLRRAYSFTQAEVAARFEVSRKTITRDMDFMRDRLGYDFAWYQSGRTWRLTKAPTPRL